MWTDHLSGSHTLNKTFFGPFPVIPNFDTKQVDKDQPCSAL